MSKLIVIDEQDELERGKDDFRRTADDLRKENGIMSKVKRTFAIIMILLVIVALIFVNVFLVKATTDKATASASEAYHIALNETSDEVYNVFYEKAYQAAEEVHHVSNDLKIVVESMREVGVLEVFRVYDQIVEIWGDDENEQQEKLKSLVLDEEITSWVQVSGSGVFTIDMAYSEVITSEEQQYVLVRVPKPVLSNFTLDEDGERKIVFESSLELNERFDLGSSKNGEKVLRIQRGNAERKMEQAIATNQDLYISARKSAEEMISALVKRLNPHLPDLIVEVEFFD